MNYMPGTASLIEDIDKKHLVLLRDGRTLIGFLRSIDQFANLVLHQTVERIHVGKKYGDIPRGIFVVRGENVVLLGEIVMINSATQPARLQHPDAENFYSARPGQRRERPGPAAWRQDIVTWTTSTAPPVRPQPTGLSCESGPAAAHDSGI
ncbi:U6 snRNA-associated Sm-like protein LSm1 isoform X1 [Dipodomys merriami]|uniref:U6 snRNA-associated Sm-like protein LSm1 isoform X1 n=1 Tax=Dipodomys merriami TaxID=94247 RepID=UPI003850FC31